MIDKKNWYCRNISFLFGGNMRRIILDSRQFGLSRLQIRHIGMEAVQFHKAGHKGTPLRFQLVKSRDEKTSVEYAVLVFTDNITTGEEEHARHLCLPR